VLLDQALQIPLPSLHQKVTRGLRYVQLHSKDVMHIMLTLWLWHKGFCKYFVAYSAGLSTSGARTATAMVDSNAPAWSSDCAPKMINHDDRPYHQALLSAGQSKFPQNPELMYIITFCHQKNVTTL